MTVIVRIPTVLRKDTEGKDEVTAFGATVGEVLKGVSTDYPALGERILMSDGKVPAFLNVFLNGEDIRFAADLATPVVQGDEISIIPSVAGG